MQIHRYCLKSKDGKPHKLHTNSLPYTSGIVCRPEEMVYSITLEECSSKDNYDMMAWKSKRNNEIDYIHKNKNLISVCFTYGVDKEIKLGRGEIVYLKIIECKECSIAKDLDNNRAEWDTK